MKKVAALLLFLIVLVWVASISQKGLTPKEIIEQKDLLIGKSITVTGKSDVSHLRYCTLMVCPEDNPCCNSCGGSLVLIGDDNEIFVRGTHENKSIVCSGNDCEINCYPLDRNNIYRVSGIWKKELDDYYLQLVSFRLIE